MKKSRASQSAFFNPRVLIGLAFCSVGLVLAMLAFGLYPGSALAQGAPTSGALTTRATAGDLVVPSEFNGDLRNLPQVITEEERKLFRPPLELEYLPPEKVLLPGTPPEIVTPLPGPLAPMPNPLVTFDAMNYNANGSGYPPDTVGDVGPNHFVQAVNTSIGIYKKTGGPAITTFTFNSLWNNARTGTPCDTAHFGDPTVVWDPQKDRFIVADFSWTNVQTGPYYECIAVSKTNNPVTGGWRLYAFRTDPGPLSRWFTDYPKMGIWPDGLYMSTNNFECSANCANSNYRGVRVFAFNLVDLETGAPLRSVVLDATDTTDNIPTESFDLVVAPALPPNWVAANAAGPAPLWQTLNVNPNPVANVAFVDDPAVVSDKRLDTPSFRVNSAMAQFSFRNNYNVENGFDGGVLEVSSPNIAGGAFTDITAAAVGGSFAGGGYNGAIANGTGNPIAGRMAWTGNSAGYITTVVNLGPNVNGQTIKLRFRMGSDNSNAGSFWAIDSIQTTASFTLLPSNYRGTLPPAGMPNLFVGESPRMNLSAWEVFKFQVDYDTPANSTFTGPTNVSQTAYTRAAPVVPEPAPGNNTDTLAERAMMQNQYRNIGGMESLWVNHTTGTANPGGAATPTGIQWAQLDVTGGVIAANPIQQQIYNNGADGLNRFVGSLAVDREGNMALGYTASSGAIGGAPDIRYAGRLATDPLNNLPQTEVTMLPGVARSVQTGNLGNPPAPNTRWGDYSAMSVDPTDDCTFWFTTQYYPVQGNNWVTRIGSFKFPSCGRVALDHFKAYQTTGPFNGDTVFLQDQFDNGPVQKTVGQPFRFANPVQKTYNNQVTQITNPDTHLKMYFILPAEPGTTRQVQIFNQFGLQTLTVQDPVLLGVPTQKNGIGIPHDVDHFKIYNATGNALNVTVDLLDQFHNEPGVQVGQPRYFGNPVRKVHNNLVTPIAHPNDFLVCYDIVPQSFGANITTYNQFGPENLVIQPADLLCVPSEKLSIPCSRDFFTENFDAVVAPALPPGWLAANAAGPAPLWVTSTVTPDTAPNAAFVDDPNVVSDKRLDTPPLLIGSGSAQVMFRHSYNLESSGGQFYDGGVLEASSPNINAGAFTDVTAAAVGGSFAGGGYNGAISTAFGSPIAGRMAWSGNSGGYINTVVNLGPNVNGQTIKLRFRMGSDSTVSMVGWRIDSITSAGVCVVPGPAVTPTQVVSRKTHGGAGTFNIVLPLTGTPGVECRSGGVNNDYQVVFTFASSVTFASAAVTSGAGSVNGTAGNGTATVTVNLTGITNAQWITVTLFGVNNGTSTGDVGVQMGVLFCDTTGNGTVNAGDLAQTKSRAGLLADATVFRSDVNANGPINAADIALVKTRIGTALP